MKKIEFPLTVDSITVLGEPAYKPKPLLGAAKCGDWIAVRPCDPESAGKTYLGVMLGEIAMHPTAFLKNDGKDVEVANAMHNPAIYVPDLKRVVFGYESWWGKIKSPEGLRKITDADIDNVWYVRALKELTEAEAAAKAE